MKSFQEWFSETFGKATPKLFDKHFLKDAFLAGKDSNLDDEDTKTIMCALSCLYWKIMSNKEQQRHVLGGFIPSKLSDSGRKRWFARIERVRGKIGV